MVQSMTLIENSLMMSNTTSFRALFDCKSTVGVRGGESEIPQTLLCPFGRRASSFHLTECRILAALSLPIGMANYLLVRQNVP